MIFWRYDIDYAYLLTKLYLWCFINYFLINGGYVNNWTVKVLSYVTIVRFPFLVEVLTRRTRSV